MTVKAQATKDKGFRQMVIFEGKTARPMAEELHSGKLLPTDTLDQSREDGGGANAVIHGRGKIGHYT